MYYARVVKTSEMPKHIFEYLRYGGSFVVDGYGDYTVGYFVKEVDESGDKESYDQKDYEKAKAVDEWFRSINGGKVVKDGDKLIIEHG